jgi:hypothetical protein
MGQAPDKNGEEIRGSLLIIFFNLHNKKTPPRMEGFVIKGQL